MKFAILATMVAAVTADDFYWNKNNNFNRYSNWAANSQACIRGNAGCPTETAGNTLIFAGPVVIPDSNECADNQWTGPEGHAINMDISATVGLLQLPMNGKIMLGEGVVMTFDEDTEAESETTWKCKALAETNWKCGANWNLDGFAEDGVVAHRVPCSSDTVVFPDDTSSYEVNVPQNTFIAALRLENPRDEEISSMFMSDSGSYSLNGQGDINRFFDVYASQFQGGVPSSGDECGSEADCAGFCYNHCAVLEGPEAEANRVQLSAALDVSADLAENYKDMVETQKASDAVMKRTVKLSEAKEIISNFQQHTSNFAAQTANLFAGSISTGGRRSGVSKEAILEAFEEDLDEKMATFAQSIGIDVLGSDAAPFCVVTATGGVACPRVGEFETTYGEVRDATAQVWTFLADYFNPEADFPGITFNGTAVGVVETSEGTPSSEEITIEFGFSDANFCVSRFAAGVYPKSNSGASGFLQKNDCLVIEDSLDMTYAKDLLEEILQLEGKVAFQTDLATEVTLTSTLDVEDTIEIIAVTPKDAAKDHAFDQARFRATFKAKSQSRHHDTQSHRVALAVATWHIITKDIAPAYAQLKAHQYSSTSTSTTTSTSTSTSTTTSTSTKVFNATALFSDADVLAELRAKSTEALLAELEAAQSELSSLKSTLAEAEALLKTNPDNADLQSKIAELKINIQAASDDEIEALAKVDKKQTMNAQAAEAPEEEGLPIIPIFAGAGALIVILLIALVLKGGGSGGGEVNNSGGRGAQSVVAFENPMYDDPANNHVTENPVADEDADGGLYDEPAFDAGEPDNATDAGGGYLDVEPEEEEAEEEEEEEADEDEEEEEESTEEEESEDDE